MLRAIGVVITNNGGLKSAQPRAVAKLGMFNVCQRVVRTSILLLDAVTRTAKRLESAKDSDAATCSPGLMWSATSM
jgi:hypothetical protein